MKTMPIALAILMLISGCATFKDDNAQPDWLQGETLEYPRAKYLLGRGSGDDLESAKDRARSDIAKIFQVTVVEHSTDKQQAYLSGDTAVSAETEINRHLTTHSEQVVSGIEIAELWRTRDKRTFHALAILPRHKARNTLQQQIQIIDQATQRYIVQAQKTDEKLLQFSYAAKAAALQQQRENLQQSLSVVNLSGRGIDPPYPLARLNSDLEEIAQRSVINIQATETLSPILTEAVTGIGFVTDAADKADYILKGSIETTDLGMQDDWYWLRSTITVELGNTTGKKVFINKSWPLKASSLDKASAQKRLNEKAVKLLNTELKNALLGLSD